MFGFVRRRGRCSAVRCEVRGDGWFGGGNGSVGVDGVERDEEWEVQCFLVLGCSLTMLPHTPLARVF